LKTIEREKIDLEKIVKTLWDGKKTIIKVTTVVFVIGVMIALMSKVEYNASCKLMPEVQDNFQSNIGGLGSIAGLAGINFNMNNNNSLLPEHYPLIAKSLPFHIELLNTPVRFLKPDTLISPYEYFLEIDRPSIFEIIYRYSFGLPFQLKRWLQPRSEISSQEISDNNTIVRLTYDEYRIYENFSDRIEAEVDVNTGIITINVEMPDALAVAEIADNSIKILTTYVTDYKISKAKDNLKFIQEGYDEAKVNFEKAQSKLELFNDRNQNVTTSIGQIEQQRLQNEYNLYFDLFKSMASQLEQAKITVKEKTPVFTVLEPVRVPIKKSKPQRIFIVSISLFFGIIISIITLFYRQLQVS
jgi:uncharacterized protein involved in exopolysaccharide biosynthesis